MTTPLPRFIFTSWNDLNGKTAPQYHYIIVRRDLPIGVMGAQIVHASGESARIVPPDPGCHAVLLAVQDEAHLLRIKERLDAHSVSFVVVTEDTAPYKDQYMAIGIPPTYNREAVRRHLSDLPLVR